MVVILWLLISGFRLDTKSILDQTPNNEPTKLSFSSINAKPKRTTDIEMKKLNDVNYLFLNLNEAINELPEDLDGQYQQRLHQQLGGVYTSLLGHFKNVVDSKHSTFTLPIVANTFVEQSLHTSCAPVITSTITRSYRTESPVTSVKDPVVIGKFDIFEILNFNLK